MESDPKKFNHVEISPADSDGIRRGLNGKPVTLEEDEQVTVGISNITDADLSAQAQSIFPSNLYLTYELPLDLFKASRFVGRVLSVYNN